MKVGWIVIKIWFESVSVWTQKYSYYIQKEFSFPFVDFFLCDREALHSDSTGRLFGNNDYAPPVFLDLL